MSVTYQLEPNLTPEEFVDVLVRSTLAERRPVSDFVTIRAMLKNADVIVTARLDGVLVGVSRAITDFAYCTYLSDLAVDEQHQRRGIGRELIRRTHEAAPLDDEGHRRSNPSKLPPRRKSLYRPRRRFVDD